MTEAEGQEMWRGVARRSGTVRFDDNGGAVLTVDPSPIDEWEDDEDSEAPAWSEAGASMVALRCMSALLTWAGKSKARVLAVGIVLGQDKRGVREASLSAKLDRTGVYRAIREARRIITKSTARAA